MSGYSEVSRLTKGRSFRQVECHGRTLELVDMPGIYETGDGESSEFMRNVRTLHETLTNGKEYTIIFVVKPLNGRVENSDLALMKLVLDNIGQGPTIGLILTQVAPNHVDNGRSPSYTTMIYNVSELQSARTGRCLTTPVIPWFCVITVMVSTGSMRRKSS